LFAANDDFQSISGKLEWHHFAGKSSASGPEVQALKRALWGQNGPYWRLQECREGPQILTDKKPNMT
jgi:hypothetical protein